VSVNIIAAMPPIGLLVKEHKEMYWHKRDTVAAGAGDVMVQWVQWEQQLRSTVKGQ